MRLRAEQAAVVQAFVGGNDVFAALPKGKTMGRVCALLRYGTCLIANGGKGLSPLDYPVHITPSRETNRPYSHPGVFELSEEGKAKVIM